jgi:hypothetical protein
MGWKLLKLGRGSGTGKDKASGQNGYVDIIYVYECICKEGQTGTDFSDTRLIRVCSVYVHPFTYNTYTHSHSFTRIAQQIFGSQSNAKPQQHCYYFYSLTGENNNNDLPNFVLYTHAHTSTHKHAHTNTCIP